MDMWDLVQRAQIRGVQRNQALTDNENLARNRRQDDRADELEDRLDQLRDVIEAMWDVLADRHGLSDDDLESAVAEVHRRREELNKPVKCIECGAAVRLADPRCQFCGRERADAPAPPPTEF